MLIEVILLNDPQRKYKINERLLSVHRIQTWFTLSLPSSFWPKIISGTKIVDKYEHVDAFVL